MNRIRRTGPLVGSLVLTSLAFSFLTVVALGLAPVLAADQSAADKNAAAPKAVDPHAAVYAASQYPSASDCAKCHQQIYDEWASSNHAYASMSPMFHKFEQTINNLASGTIGNFCVRCHASVGTTLGEPRELPLWKRQKVSREGVTCITCHRIDEQFQRVNGERRIVPGDIHEPVYGNIGGDGVSEVVAKKDFYKVKPSSAEKGPGMDIHRAGVKFEQLSGSEFCMSCHQVAVHPGIKLEVVWDQYRSSPAAKQGISCQQCHMGKVPGRVSGYETGAVAIVSGKKVNEKREHHNHAFFGPGYPIAHPGIFPHNPKSEQFPIEAWLKFDYRAGWGTPEFEDKVYKGQLKVEFPKEWADDFDRETARGIIEENIKKLELKKQQRQQVMENGTRLDGPFFERSPRAGKSLEFSYVINNIDEGHNFPSGSLGAQPEIWLDVALIDPSGKNIWESGYVDAIGDMADQHSLELAAGRIEHDDQLVNLQTKFITTNVKGTDREMYLPVNLDLDQRPFIRPIATPNSVLNHPPFVRMEQRSIPPGGKRVADYEVPGRLLTQPGTYKLAVRLRSRAEPIYFMRFVKATTAMEQAMNEWMLDFHASTVSFEIK